MGVVNNNLARRESLNGRLDVERDEKGQALNPGRLITCDLLPGLNKVSDDQIQMLRENESFEIYEAAGDIEIVEYDEDGREDDEAPNDMEDIDITGLGVKKAGKMLSSVATIELLDKFEEQENGGEQRKGVLALLSKHRVRVQEIIDAQQGAGEE